jgi:hypothetical protein
MGPCSGLVRARSLCRTVQRFATAVSLYRSLCACRASPARARGRATLLVSARPSRTATAPASALCTAASQSMPQGRYGKARMHATVCAHVWMCAHLCCAQITAADGNHGVVCMRKRHAAVRSFTSIPHTQEHSDSHLQGSAAQRSTVQLRHRIGHKTEGSAQHSTGSVTGCLPHSFRRPPRPCMHMRLFCLHWLATLQVFSKTGETIPRRTAGPESLESTDGECSAPLL